MDEPREYRVILQPEAIDGIEEAFRWIERAAPEAAVRWRHGLYDAIRSLSTFPGGYPLAPEAHSFHEKIRQTLYGKRGGVYRILFTVLEPEATVVVLHVRHSARRRLSSQSDADADDL